MHTSDLVQRHWRTTTILPKLQLSHKTENAFTQSVQLPHTYTTVVYQCYTLVIVQITTHNTTLGSYHITRAAPFTATQMGKFHTARAAIMHLLPPQQDWRSRLDRLCGLCLKGVFSIVMTAYKGWVYALVLIVHYMPNYN